MPTGKRMTSPQNPANLSKIIERLTAQTSKIFNSDYIGEHKKKIKSSVYGT